MTRPALAARGVLAALLLVNPLVGASAACAFDPAEAYREGTWVLSGEAGYGAQIHMREPFADLDFVDVGVRIGLVPFGEAGPGILRGAFEIGLEPIYQRYVNPVNAFYAGLAAVARYHFTSLGRFVPYVELAGAAGGTDLRVAEQQSAFGFLLFGGAGIAYFVGDRTSIYAGYRFQHVSNAYTSRPNVGINSNNAVVGVSYFFE
jgi:opacity protein-like surface antigen